MVSLWWTADREVCKGLGGRRTTWEKVRGLSRPPGLARITFASTVSTVTPRAALLFPSSRAERARDRPSGLL